MTAYEAAVRLHTLGYELRIIDGQICGRGNLLEEARPMLQVIRQDKEHALKVIPLLQDGLQMVCVQAGPDQADVLKGYKELCRQKVIDIAHLVYHKGSGSLDIFFLPMPYQ